MKQRILFLLFVVFSLLTACKKEISSPKDSLVIQKFIWSNMSTYYLWADSVPKLTYEYFNNDTNKIKSFLNGYSDPEKLFYDLIYKRDVVDKWSWIESDYHKLENELQGVSKSIGYNFGLVRFSGSNNIFGYVNYVLKGSPAEKAGIKRGDIFIKVNGQTPTVDNYQTLLFDQDSYKFEFADFQNDHVVPNNRTVTVTAVEFQENPIFLDTVYTVNNTNVGYLIYNGFYPDFDKQLNQVFQDFKSKGVQKLILDLRYNGGGSVLSADYLASMIYSTNTSKIFCKNQYNKLVNDYILTQYGADYMNYKFSDKIQDNTSQVPINTLNLPQLYVITTRRTASASELVINGLKAYIPVTTIGDTTVGKNVGSMTIKDEDANGHVNPNNLWAMQLIILKIANANGESNYSKGFVPTVLTEEDIRNMQPLGSTNERLLSAALASATGQGVVKSRLTPLNIRRVAESKDFMRSANEMYVEFPRIKK